MRPSRFIGRGSGVRLRASLTRQPLPPRSKTTHPPPTSDKNSSQRPSYDLLEPKSQLHALESAPVPSYDDSTQNDLSEQSNVGSFEELHRKIWGDHPQPLPEVPAPHTEQDPDPPSNEAGKEITDFPEPRSNRERRRCEKAWRRELKGLRRRSLVHDSEPAFFGALMGCKTADEARRIWADQDAETIKDGWTTPLLMLLTRDVRQACLFLQALCPLSDPPVVAMSDSISHIRLVLEKKVGSWTGKTSDPWVSSVANLLCDTVIHILREHPGRTQLLNQDEIFRLQKDFRPERVAELYDELGLAGVSMHDSTLMHIACTLADTPDLKRIALGILVDGLRRLNSHISESHEWKQRRDMWALVFTKILHTRYSAGPNFPEPPTTRDVIHPDEMWDIALAYGLKPNPIHTGALIDSLFAVGRGDAAWEVFDTSREERENQNPVDLQMTTILLSGSRKVGSLPNIQRALAIAAEAGEMDGILGSEILQLVVGLGMADSTNLISSFRTTRRLFSRMFKKEALNELIPERLHGVVDQGMTLEDMFLSPGFAEPLDKLFAAQKGMVIDAPPEALTLMVLSWMCSLKQGFKGPAVVAFYGHYRRMLKQRHPVAMSIVKWRGSIIHDMVVKGMGASPTHLRSALEVIGHMLRDNEESVRQSRGARENMAVVAHPRPTAWTWNILLHAWLRHFKQESVTRIVSLMKKHGVEPTIVTWNTVLSRAAQRGNTNLAAMAAQEIRDGGHAANDWTVRAFSHLRDKEKFLRTMQESESDTVRPEGTKHGPDSRKWSTLE